MTPEKLSGMSTAERIEWYNSVNPFRSVKVGDDVFCLHCNGYFKAEDVACDRRGLALCPGCHDGNPADFASMPWWRDDLTEPDGQDEEGSKVKWIGLALHAESGVVKYLPKPPPSMLRPSQRKRGKV